MRFNIGVQTSSIGVDDRVVQAWNALVPLDIRTVCKDALDTRGIIHCEVETGDCAVTPSKHRYLTDVEMVK